MKASKILFLASIILLSSAALTGCRKKKETIAKILVRDSANQPVSGATVELQAGGGTVPGASVNTDYFPMTTTSNSAGEAVFNFDEIYQLGQAGVVVLDIKVTSGSGNGQGVIKVEEETTTEETVFV